MANQIISFGEAINSVRENNEPFVAYANEESVNFSEAVFSIVNKTEDVQKYTPADVMKHVFTQDGIRLVSFGRNIASPLAKFEKAYQKNFLMDYWDGKYQRKFLRMPPMAQFQMQQFNAAGSQTSLTPGEAWRLYTDISPKVAVLEPDIPLASIVVTTFPSNTKIARIPEITITRQDASMDDVEEGALPKKGKIAFRKSAEEMDKAGILLELTDEMQGNDAPYGVDLVSMFMERAGVDDEIEIVAEVIKKALAEAGARPDDVITLSGREILDLQSSFKRGRRADRVIGPKTAVLDYVDALSRAYRNQDNSTAAARELAQPMVINSMSRPTLAGWLDDVADTSGPNKGHNDALDAGFEDGGTVTTDDLLLMDSMNSMGLITYQGDPYQAENYDVIRNVHQHVMTRWHASYVQVDAPLRRVRVAAATTG